MKKTLRKFRQLLSDINYILSVIVNDYIAKRYTLLMFFAEIDFGLKPVKFLLKYGAKVDKINKEYGCTALMIACRWNKNVEVIKTLIENGADVNAQDFDGDTPLMWAATDSSSLEVMKILLNAGADINIKNNKGENVLMHVVLCKNKTQVIKYLIKAGVDINEKDENGTNALMYSVTPKNTKTLIEAGININSHDNKGYTALKYSVIYPKVNKVLREAGLTEHTVKFV